MQSEWQSHLENNHANIINGSVSDYGNVEQELQAVTGNICADLSHYSLISAEGVDTHDFLQSQFSNDVKLVSATKSQLSTYCSPKGRILASFRLFFSGDKYFLELPTDLLEASLKRLRMYVLRSQVTLEDASASMSRMGLAGPDIENYLHDIGVKTPVDVDEVSTNGHVTVIRIPGSTARFEIHGPASELIMIWNKLEGKVSPVGASVWGLHDIRSGIPVIQAETVDSFVPQMVNLELINGVSFKKGCYPGQEIVARMQYLGKLKKRMYRASIQTDEPIQPGEALFSGSSDNSQSIGNIVNAALSPQGGYDVLAVMQITEAEQGDVRLARKDGASLEIRELPYSLSA